MLISELPDECLLMILQNLNELSDLINCYEVCVKWSYLVAERTRKVKYLIEGYFGYPVHAVLDDSSYCVYYEEMEPNHGTVLKTLFRNLEILDLRHAFEQLDSEDIVELVRNQKSLKGLYYSYELSKEAILKYCNKLEMVFTHYIDEDIIQKGSGVKQLKLWDTLDGFKRVTHNFINLERLVISNCQDIPDSYYDGPTMEKLKIFEYYISECSEDSNDYTYHCFQFMDLCPNLQSAYIVVNFGHLFIDESLKQQCLQDLVLDITENEQVNWSILKTLFRKYPNLKHLSIWDNGIIKDKHIKKLIKILPNLVLLYVAECHGVTESAVDSVQDYCKRYGRSIKVYFKGNKHEIKKDWPQLSTKIEAISQGFNFMKHCFLKDCYSVPDFLIS